MAKKSHDNRKLEDHLGRTADFKHEGNRWNAQEISTESTPLMDEARGAPIILRVFEFAANPEAFKYQIPTKEQLVSDHKKGIELFLWKDGLRPIESMRPKVIISKKKDRYSIYVTCQARPGVSVVDKPKTLQEIIKPNGR